MNNRSRTSNDRRTHAARRLRARAGFTLIEASLATIVLGVMTVASMNLVAGAVKTRAAVSNQSDGVLLAGELAEEIAALRYAEPTADADVLGVEAGEDISAADRVLLDDLDDYNGFRESPCKDKLGRVIPGTTGVRREVAVEFLNPADPQQTAATDFGLKRITVRVFRNGSLQGTVQAVRSRSVDALRFREDDAWDGSSIVAGSGGAAALPGAGAGGAGASPGGAARPTYSFSAARSSF